MTTLSKAIVVIGLVVVLAGAYLYYMPIPSEPVVEHIFNDGGELESGQIMWLTFIFRSKSAFTTNYPIHVRVVLLLSKNSEELLPIEIRFPEAYDYPKRIFSSIGTPKAGIINMSSTPPYSGEGDIEFTQAGGFGYMIFSKGMPRVVVEREVIKVSPYEVRLQIENSRANQESNQRMLGLTLAGIGVAVMSIAVAITAKQNVRVKTKRARKAQVARSP